MAEFSTISKKPFLAVRGSDGVSINEARDQPGYSQLNKLQSINDTSNNCRVMTFHSSGKYFAYCNNSQVRVISIEDGKELFTIRKPRTSFISFSTLGTYVVLWEPFYANKNDNSEVENLSIYNVKNGSLLKSFQQKKQLEKFIQWNNNEETFALILNGELRFFDVINPNNFVKKITVEGLTAFDWNINSQKIAVHASGKKNQPSFVRLYAYPNLNEVISNKSFFNADRVEIKWNKLGTYLLVLCSTETSANSYYGDTSLHYLNTNGDSLAVTLSKKGPIYSVEWNPIKDEFIVVYGATPAKATLFNNKCEAIFDFGTDARNECFFSPLGNIVCLCGFGNIRGRIEVWNLGTSNKAPERICSIAADDTTFFEWCPDGEHILTATTSPRLRVSNGFKIWNYIGESIYSYSTPQNVELWQVQWQPGVFLPTSSAKQIKKPAVIQEEVKAYIPPHLRGKGQVSSVKLKLHEDDEKPDTQLKIKRVEDPAAALEKKIKAVKKKLQQIDELKKKQELGEQLENNQLEKVRSEKTLLEELEKLNIKH